MTSIELKRMEDESPFEYHKRLVYGKLVDKTLADIDYTELSELVYGQSYSSDTARRMMYGSRRTLELIDAERITAGDNISIADEIEAKIVELKKERQKFFDQRREYNKMISADGRKEHLYDVLAQAANHLNSTVGNLYKDSPQPTFSTGSNEAVLVFSDWHYGMTTENIFNNYNTKICKERVYAVVNAATQRLLLHQCSKLHIVVLGDLFHGAIHTSARVASEELVCDQIMQVSEILAQSVIELSRYVKDTTIYMTYGNHGRTIQNKKDNIHRDNMERLIPWWLSQRLSAYPNISVSFNQGNEILLIDAAGHKLCATHGDLDKVKSSPRLLGTLLNKQLGTDIEYILLGDKHHRESFEELGITAMLCGSLCGTDDYANNKRLFSSPSQLLLVISENCGIDAEYRINCK